MADEAQATKKGGSKIAIIGVSIVMLLTGGFFGLKMHGGSQASQLELGPILPIHEFLVNLKDDPSKYLRTEISAQCDANFPKAEMDTYNDAIMDAIVGVLRDESMDDVRSTTGMNNLKRRLAAAANAAYWRAKGKSVPEASAKHPEWDSDSGPILKVYFTSFAFQ